MKEELRRKGLELRNNMSDKEVKKLSNQIIEHIKQQIDLNQYQVLGFYMPLGNEVDLRPLMSGLIAQGKTVVIPKVQDRNTMDFYPIKDIEDIHEGRFHVLEPNSHEKMPKNEIEILFIPGIYFSHDHYRLGFGAGYYDRYLKDYQNQKIGVCFGFQYIPSIPTNVYDIPVDFVITENPLHRYHDVD